MHIRIALGVIGVVISLMVSQFAHAAPVRTVNACDMAIGADPSLALKGATISHVKSGDYGTPSDFFSAVGDPALVEVGPSWDVPGSSACLDRQFSGATFYLTSLMERDLTPGSDPLFEGIWATKVDFAAGARSVSVTGIGFWDNIAAMLFDANGNSIFNSAVSWQSVYEEFPLCDWGTVCDDPYLAYAHTVSFSLMSGAPISTMFIGAEADVPAWITRISYSPYYVPEPNIIGLLLFGLIFLAFTRRETNA